MARGKIFFSAVITLVCIAFLGFGANGYCQERSATSAGPGVQQSSTLQTPQPYPRTKRRGLTATVNLDVTPSTYAGPCPAVFTLNGHIYANKAMTILYKIVRSDNTRMEPIALTFEKEGWKEITYTRQIGDSGKSVAFNEWALIEVVYPVNVKIRSNAAILKGSCGDQPDLKPQLMPGQREEQKGQSAGPTGFSGTQPQGRGPLPTGLPMDPLSQQKPPATGNFPAMPPGSGGPGPNSFPMPQPGQTGQGPGGMPIIQPGQGGPMPGGSPTMPGDEKGPVPGSFPAPQPGVKVLPGTQK